MKRDARATGWIGTLATLVLLAMGCGSDAKTATDAGGLADSAADVPTDPCPLVAPTPGTQCPVAGLRCTYDNSGLSRYVCSETLTWVLLTVEDAGAPEAGVAGDAGPALSCQSYSMSNCPRDTCRVGCCPSSSGNDTAGCPGCCMDRMCQEFDASTCPLDRCTLMPKCGGGSLCYPRLLGPTPTCGSVGYYGAQVACCAGLTLRCGNMRADGSCAPDAGGYDNIPVCLACGNGVCESAENRCNCPEDCK